MGPDTSAYNRIMGKLALATVTPNAEILKKLMESDAFTEFVRTYNLTITLVLGIITITIITILFINITKLSASTGSDFKRREAINGILVSLVCLAIVGGIDTVYAILVSFVFSM